MTLPEMKYTADGSVTLVDPVSGDSYHSMNGASTESEHVFIRNGLATMDGPVVRVLEMGYGTGLNALLTYEYAYRNNLRIEYTAVEKFPVPEIIWEKMDYCTEPVYQLLNSAEWGMPVAVSPSFTLHKIEGDFAKIEFDTIFDIVYYDAFAPDTQPELWTTEVFSKVWNAIADNGRLVTYSAKGVVKQNLRAVGFTVRRLEGAPGKRHMLRAQKVMINKMIKQFDFKYEHFDDLSQMGEQDRLLIEKAKQACHSAFAPYSNFHVGAAAILESGKIITGSNQESEVFPAGVCAERSLLFHHQAHYSDDPIVTLAVASVPDQRECYPCGICRQVINDTEKRQARPIRVIMTGSNSATVLSTAKNLLPFIFEL